MTFLTECKSEYIVALFSDQTISFFIFSHTRKITTIKKKLVSQRNLKFGS